MPVAITTTSPQFHQRFAAAASRAGYDSTTDSFQPAQQTGPAPRRISAGPTDRSSQFTRKASVEEATGALDEATRDLLRLSAEPISAGARSLKRSVQKAASASSVPQSMRPRTANYLR